MNPFYTDKSEFISDLENSSHSIEMVLNPNGMFTAENIDMLERFYGDEGQHAQFQSLTVGSSVAMREQGRHPVVYLDFASFNASSWKEAKAFFKERMSDLYQAHRSVINPEKTLSELDLEDYYKVVNQNADSVLLEYSLKYLLQFIKKATHEKPVLLVNGVDKPFEVAGMHGYVKHIESFFSGFYVSWAKDIKCCHYLHRAILFGCSHVMQGSVHTGLNNIQVHSPLESGLYRKHFGLTELEMKSMLAKYDLPTSLMEEIKQVAGGYLDGDDCVEMIINPGLAIKYIQTVQPALALDSGVITCPTLKDSTTQYYLTRAIETRLISMDTVVRLLAQRENFQSEFYICANMPYDNFSETEAILSYLVYQGLLASIPDRNSSRNARKLIIPNQAAYNEIKKRFFDDEQFNRNRLPCLGFYPVATRLTAQAEAKFHQLILNLGHESVDVVLSTLTNVLELSSILTREVYKPIADLLCSPAPVVRKKAKDTLQRFNMMRDPYVMAKLAAGATEASQQTVDQPPVVIVSKPMQTKPEQVKDIVMSANYRKMVGEALAYVPRQAFFHAMTSEAGKIKCFFAPGASFKTSLISMIECCFNAGYRPEEAMEAWSDETYPVLKFSFSDLNHKLVGWLKWQLNHITDCHPDVNFDEEAILAMLEKGQAAEAMRALIDVLHQAYQKPVVVLIDSATKPFYSDSLASDTTIAAFVTAFCSGLLNNPNVYAAGLFGVNEGAHLLFSEMDEVKSYSTRFPNPFRKYFALSEREAEDLIKQAFKVESIDLKPMIEQLKKACTLFTEAGQAYLHTWYTCLYLRELEHSSELSGHPVQLGYRYDNFSSEACRIIEDLFNQSDEKARVLAVFSQIFNDSSEGYILYDDHAIKPDYRLQDSKSVIHQMISGGFLRAEQIDGDWYRIQPANAFASAKILPAFNELLQACHNKLRADRLTQTPVTLFSPAPSISLFGEQQTEVMNLSVAEEESLLLKRKRT